MITVNINCKTPSSYTLRIVSDGVARINVDGSDVEVLIDRHAAYAIHRFLETFTIAKQADNGSDAGARK